MDYPMFLNSSGGIVTPYDSGYHWPMGVVPYFETVRLPVVSVDSSAIYGDHPENLMTVTYSSGAALTFFVDSVPGGNDSSGNGSFDDPWRSLNTASRFLSCAECMLNTAAPYIQLKVRGTVDYLSGEFNPKPHRRDNLIVAGWDEICNFDASGRAPYLFAGYVFRARARIANNNAVASDSVVLFGNSTLYALDCAIETNYELGGVYNCSDGSSNWHVAAGFCSGGSFSKQCEFGYVCDPLVAGPSAVLYGSALAGAVVSVSRANEHFTSLGGAFVVSARYARNCRVSAVASGFPSGGRSNGSAVIGGILGGVVSGGVVAVSAFARASGGEYPAASAVAMGLGSRVSAHGVQVTLMASAGARIVDSSVRAYEYERTRNLANDCWTSRTYHVSSGVVTSTVVSSGGVCP